jgi:porphobilinogen deaminase
MLGGFGYNTRARLHSVSACLVQVQEKLMHTNDECLHTVMAIEVIETHGDLDRLTPLRKLGSGAFTVLIDEAVANADVDIGVHSLKDSPVLFPEGVILACCLPREDPRDAFISPKAKTIGARQQHLAGE